MAMRMLVLALAAAAAVRAALGAADAGVQAADADADAWRFDAGGDLRVRQEIMNNLPGLPNAPYALAPAPRAPFRNHFRIRPRAWFELEKGPLRLYARVADEFRHYPTLHVPRHSRAYYFPDELFLDNLYLEGRGLESEALALLGVSSLDFRVGRQDLLERGHSVFGLDRIIAEGTPTDGSRSFYSDMVRARLHFDEAKALDVFALYDFGRNDVSWGTSRSRGRNLNCINMTDSNDLDEWGGGLIYSQTALNGDLPFKLYTMFKRAEAHTTQSPAVRRCPAKEVTLLGFWAEPRFAEAWRLELEGGRQFGRILDGNRQAGGYMAHAELKYEADLLRACRPVLSAAVTYYSGDRHRTGEDDNDTAWDPMWGRYTQDSEMLVYGTLYANCWWSNMIYAKAKLTMSFGPRHGCYLYSGPMFAAVQDDLGRTDGNASSYRGLLSAARYDFPLRLAAKGASFGWDRVEIVAHVVGELFNPGDYYASSRPAYFVRWQVEFQF